MKKLKRALWIGGLVLACIGLDQVTKHLARKHLANAGDVGLLQGLCRLTYTENPGAFLSLGANSSPEVRTGVFVVLVGAFLIGVFLYLLLSRAVSVAQTAALAFAIGGGIGNLIDRLANEGRVIDFMVVGVGPVRTGVFNVADLAVWAGGIVFIVLMLRKPRPVTVP